MIVELSVFYEMLVLLTVGDAETNDSRWTVSDSGTSWRTDSRRPETTSRQHISNVAHGDNELQCRAAQSSL